MNSKKAKNLRQLARHLIASGKIDGAGNAWAVYSQDNRGTVQLDPSCGRAIYQSMKKHELRHRHG